MRRVLQGGGQSLLAEKTIRDRVARRFPEAAPLPVRAELDRIVEDAVPGMHWDGSNYVRASAAMPASSTRFTAMFGAGGDSAEVQDMRRRLQASLVSRSGLVLAVDPRLHDAAVGTLEDQFAVTHVDLSARLVQAAKEYSAKVQANWQFILRMDANATGGDRDRLHQFMATAFDSFWPEIVASPEPLLLTGAAVLARYDQQYRLAEFTNEAQPNPAARWVLVPHRASNAVPTLDGVAVPLGAAGWLGLPAGLVRPPGGAAAVG